MLRGVLTLTLSLCLGAAAAPAALAQAAAPITEQEAHAIAVDAYVYFYSYCRWTYPENNLQNGRTRHGSFKGSDEHVRQTCRIPACRLQGVVRSNFDTPLFRFSWLDMTKEPVVIFGSGY